MRPAGRGGGGRPHQPPTALTTKSTTTRQDQPQGSATSARYAAPLAVAEVLPPAGRRTRAALLVRRCPWCQHAHLHRTTHPGAGWWHRLAGCGQGTYAIRTIPEPRGRWRS